MSEDHERRSERFREAFDQLRSEMGKILVGQEEIIRGVLAAFFVEGHVLLEGAPGLGKTAIVRTLAAAAGLRFSRIQFTPDLMPSDIIGTNLIIEDEHGAKRFRFEPGPIFANIVLADEINRATPKTQSALLEAMQERQITVAGEQHSMHRPFLVLATSLWRYAQTGLPVKPPRFRWVAFCRGHASCMRHWCGTGNGPDRM